MSIDPRSHVPFYRQLADALRKQIDSGELVPGMALPSEARLTQEFGVGREAVRMAIALLRSEGLVTTVRGHGTRVREVGEREPVELPPGSSAIARMPSDAERVEHDLDEGVPVVEIQHPDGRTEVHPGDRVRLQRP